MTFRVYPRILLRRLASGKAVMLPCWSDLTDPNPSVLPSLLKGDRGPRMLEYPPNPLAEPMCRNFPSLEMESDEGYQVVGMNPRTWLSSRSPTWITATQ